MEKLFISLILILTSGIINGQELTPLELVEKVFTDKEFAKNKSKYSTGEYKGSPNATDFKKRSKLNFRLLSENENSAVVNMTIIDGLSNGMDTYVHLIKNKKWKIEAFRALAMTGILQKMKSEFEKMTDKEIDSLLKIDKRSFKSKKDFRRELENIKLTLAFDDKIIEHFKKNKDRFEEIKRALLNVKIKEGEVSHRKINLGRKIKLDYKGLLINSISNNYNCEKCFEFVIGGMIDNTVGYLYIPEGEIIPKMNSSRLIMLREIGNGWYIFKTT